MNGSRKLFHVHQKVKMMTVAMAGLLRGTITFQITCQTFAPSIRAASSSSLGIEEKNCRNMKIKKALPKNERMNKGQSVFTILSRVKNSYTGTRVTGKGSIIVLNSTRNRKFLPGAR